MRKRGRNPQARAPVLPPARRVPPGHGRGVDLPVPGSGILVRPSSLREALEQFAMFREHTIRSRCEFLLGGFPHHMVGIRGRGRSTVQLRSTVRHRGQDPGEVSSRQTSDFIDGFGNTHFISKLTQPKRTVNPQLQTWAPAKRHPPHRPLFRPLSFLSATPARSCQSSFGPPPHRVWNAVDSTIAWISGCRRKSPRFNASLPASTLRWSDTTNPRPSP